MRKTENQPTNENCRGFIYTHNVQQTYAKAEIHTLAVDIFEQQLNVFSYKPYKTFSSLVNANNKSNKRSNIYGDTIYIYNNLHYNIGYMFGSHWRTSCVRATSTKNNLFFSLHFGTAQFPILCDLLDSSTVVMFKAYL